MYTLSHRSVPKKKSSCVEDIIEISTKLKPPSSPPSSKPNSISLSLLENLVYLAMLFFSGDAHCQQCAMTCSMVGRLNTVAVILWRYLNIHNVGHIFVWNDFTHVASHDEHNHGICFRAGFENVIKHKLVWLVHQDAVHQILLWWTRTILSSNISL